MATCEALDHYVFNQGLKFSSRLIVLTNNFNFLFSDNEEKLNLEEKKFVDDLFPDPPSGEKRCQQDPKNSNPAKRTKTSDDEVILSVFSTMSDVVKEEKYWTYSCSLMIP